MTTVSQFHKIENMKSENVIVALGALAQESRLDAFRLLVRRGPEGYTPGDLAQRLGIPAPTLSFHLKELQRAQLIAARREGRFLHYSANFEAMQSVIAFLTDKCCSLASAQCDADCAPGARAKRRRA
jgi:ArsR family transcriptional regulator